MRSRMLRLYVAGVTLLGFLVLWALIAAKPWAGTAARPGLDPRLAALNGRQRRLEREARLVKRTLDRRWRDYRQRLRQRQAQIHELERRHAAQVAAAARVAGTVATYASASGGAAAVSPTARVVTLPPQVKVVTLAPAAAPATSSGSSHP
ncbi:MAG TPA: hypothetical protein VFU52_02300 [Gaiellaceae bacterium]|nr:hypothetical protein [Gaiellaceae bacterium]